MMVLFALGLGNAGMSLMTEMPAVRDAMLLPSPVMVGAIAYQISRPSRPFGWRVVKTLSRRVLAEIISVL